MCRRTVSQMEVVTGIRKADMKTETYMPEKRLDMVIDVPVLGRYQKCVGALASGFV